MKFDSKFIAKHKRDTQATTPILFFHTWKDGDISYQGYIYRLAADGTGEAQLFDWLVGAASETIIFTKAFLYDCTFYTSDYEMNVAYRSHAEARKKRNPEADAFE